MIFIKEMVPASEIWPGADNHTDRGWISGYVRGYNAEIITQDGATSWLSCEYIDTDPELHYDSEYYRWRCKEHGWKLTGRFCFRGYGMEKYDPEFNETYVEKVED